MLERVEDLAHQEAAEHVRARRRARNAIRFVRDRQKERLGIFDRQSMDGADALEAIGEVHERNEQERWGSTGGTKNLTAEGAENAEER